MSSLPTCVGVWCDRSTLGISVRYGMAIPAGNALAGPGVAPAPEEVDMRRHSLRRGVVLAAALVVTGAALPAAPWPGLARSVSAPGSGIRYVAVRHGGETSVRALRGDTVVASRTVSGLYGIPAVTIGGAGGGVSPRGKRVGPGGPPEQPQPRPPRHLLGLAAPALRPPPPDVLP